MNQEVKEKVALLARDLGVSEDKVVELAVSYLYSKVNPQPMDENVKRLQYFKERGILTKTLAIQISETLLTKGWREVLKLLRIKAEKKRFLVTDDELISEFVEFMQKFILSTNPTTVVQCLSKVFIDLESRLPKHVMELLRQEGDNDVTNA